MFFVRYVLKAVGIRPVVPKSLYENMFPINDMVSVDNDLSIEALIMLVFTMILQSKS